MTDVKMDNSDIKENSEVNVKENNKSDSSKTNGTSDTVLEKKILRQLEYYFGDFNLPKDKYLLEEVKKDEGWVEVDTMLKFNRLKNLSTDKNVIIAAVKKSELLEVNEDNQKLRRRLDNPLPEFNDERKKELFSRGAYVKGFPKTINLETILAYFDKLLPESPPENVFMRFYKDKITKTNAFKGSIFVTFKTVEECKKFIESGPYKYDEKDEENLIIKWKQDYFDEKKEEQKNAKSARKGTVAASKGDNEFELPECSVLHLSNISGDTVREDFKSKIGQFAEKIAFIDFCKGDAEGWIRFYGDSTASDCFQTLTDGILEIGELKITCKILEGDEKATYLEKVKEEMKRHKQSYNKNKGGKNKGGKNKGQKRKGGKNDDFQRKKQKN